MGGGKHNKAKTLQTDHTLGQGLQINELGKHITGRWKEASLSCLRCSQSEEFPTNPRFLPTSPLFTKLLVADICIELFYSPPPFFSSGRGCLPWKRLKMPDIHFPVSQFAAMDDRTTQEMGCISLPNQKEGGEFFQTPPKLSLTIVS